MIKPSSASVSSLAWDAERSAPEANDPPPKTVPFPIVDPLRPAPSLITTPPPSSERKLSRAVFNDPPPDECGIGLRPGDTFVGFKLVEELGQGAFARVFLAHQESLAGRPVALKVTLRPTKEPERLARLQHTNVVPVYSVHTVPPVQVICMPFLGRRTIADVIRAYRADQSSSGSYASPGRRTAGTRAAKTTDVVSSAASAKPHSGQFAVPRARVAIDPDTPPIIGDPHAVLKIIGQLAAGLAHAHGRGILHLDLKPANVLLPDVAEPMLLDFNLAFDMTTADRELVGGTVPYMAIEQLLDLRTRGRGNVDARTDLYSLGVMAFEMLTGYVPFPASSKDLIDMDGLIEARRQGPPPLRELNPRVSPAVEAIIRKLLAPEPADRYRTAEELKTDVERHLNNLPLKFAREASVRERFAKWRRRNPGLTARLFAASLVGLLLGLGVVAYEKSEAEATQEVVARARSTRAALDTTRLDLVLPCDPAARSRGIKKAEELLALHGKPSDADWLKRSDVRRLSNEDCAALAGDLGELQVLLARAKGETDAAFEPPVGRERFLDATAKMAAATYAPAIELFRKIVADHPEHAAAQFCLAYCRQQLGQTERALEAYDAAERLLPADARPAFQRGVIYGMQSNHPEAEKEFTRALALDPDYAQAYRNRGMARFRLNQFPEAETDLTRALDLGASAFQIHVYRAKVRRQLGNAVGAIADERAAADLPLTSESDYVARGRLRIDSNPKGALEDFKAALDINPQSLNALQNLIHALADKLNEPKAALDAATRLVELYPDYATGRIARAIYLARLGHRSDAHAEVDRALKLSKKDNMVVYRAACVYALTSATNPEDEVKAIQLLKDAVRDGFRDVKHLQKDGDFKAVRDNEQFRNIVDALDSLYQ